MYSTPAEVKFFLSPLYKGIFFYRYVQPLLSSSSSSSSLSSSSTSSDNHPKLPSSHHMDDGNRTTILVLLPFLSRFCKKPYHRGYCVPCPPQHQQHQHQHHNRLQIVMSMKARAAAVATTSLAKNCEFCYKFICKSARWTPRYTWTNRANRERLQ